MKKTFFAAAALVAMVSCNKTLIETPESEFGYIDLGISADTEMITTKAEQTVNQSGSKYLLTLIRTDVPETKFENKEYGLLNPSVDLKVAAGTYTFSAQNITATDAEKDYGALRLYGEHADLNVIAGGNTPASIQCTPANAMVTVDVAANFGSTFKEYSISLIDGNRDLAITTLGHVDSDGKTVTKSFFNIENGTLYWQVAAKVNNEAQFKYFKSTFTVEKGKHHKITLAPGTNGTISVTITANDELTSIDVPATVDPLTPVQSN